MKATLDQEMLAAASRRIEELLGLGFPRPKWQTLEKAICRAAQKLGFDTPVEYASRLVSTEPDRQQLEVLAALLTVGETYFLRESRTFEIMEQEIIPELLRTRQGNERRLRIWSAGCATGEEAYTIAILLRRMSTLLKGWEITILATDVNPDALEKAMAGVYTEWSFRSPPNWFRENNFRRRPDKRYELLPEIRRMVTFSCLNLAEDVYPSLATNTNAMDMIFCRNVLMYFTPEQAEQVVERLRLALVDGGRLFVSPCEASPILGERFRVMNYGDAIIYRKGRTGEKENRGIPAHLPPFSPSPLRDLPPVSPSPFQELPPLAAARNLYGQGHYAEAAQLLTARPAESGDDAPSLALLCRICANEGKLDAALRLSEQAIAADKTNAGLHYLHAVILQELGEIDGAAASLKRALYLDQELVLAHYSLGNLALRMGREKESRRYFANCLALLRNFSPDDIVPESDGMLAGRLAEIIESAAGKGLSVRPDRVMAEEGIHETRRFGR